jgi:exopolyphosphatase/guanosine-5'-triphosphate,3'-diphosphate pyrophosphatase
MKTQTIAAIDIGSNSIKLAIVEAAASDSFTIVLQERERVRLGHETLRNKMLSPEAINLSAEAIAKFRSIAETREADSIIAVATASVREAENSAEFVHEVEKRTGITVEVLSSIEEARLIGIAAAQNCGLDNKTLLNIDIGGGSTELSLMKDGEPHKLFSMKLGAVGLTEKYIFSNPPKKKELENLRAEIVSALEHPLRKIKGETWQISTGTSGTILNLASLISLQNGENNSENCLILLKKLVLLNQKLAQITLEDRVKFPVISSQRAEVIVAGGQILENVMRALKIETLQPCVFALREGVIIDYLREIEAESLPPVPDVEDRRLRGVFAIGRRFGYEERHALQTAFLAEKIFDQLALYFNLKRHGRTLLSAAGILHDIGYHISHESHHKHSLYLIKNSEITGFTENEKAMIANIARYHRGSLPKEKHSDFMALSENDQRTVWKLGAILRIADALDHGYEKRIKDIKIKLGKSNILLKILSNDGNSVEMQAVERKKDMFETAFNCKLEIAVEKQAV